jgi:hypothetical protein
VPVTSLSVNELDRLRQQLTADVENLLESNSILQRAVTRADAAGKAVATLAGSQPGVLFCCQVGTSPALAETATQQAVLSLEALAESHLPLTTRIQGFNMSCVCLHLQISHCCCQ